jgi:hypothetical protein
MRTWNLKPGDPFTLIIAADYRSGKTNYLDDQIWEISISERDPGAVSIYTTYGLRARSMRMFPRFSVGNMTATNPNTFHTAPEICQFFPDYVKLSFSPFPYIDVFSEYWVPESNSLSGRLNIKNTGDSPIEIQVDWIAQLTPNEGQPMAQTNIEAAPVLAGKTQDLFPLIFITGGPQPGTGSYPSLYRTFKLDSGEGKHFTWIQSAQHTVEESFARSREIANLNFDAEIAKLESINSSFVEIYTGEQDWDAVFSHSQKQGIRLVLNSTDCLPESSFVLNRLPDQGYSLKGDGSDYNHLWNGQSAIEAYYLATILPIGSNQLLKGILNNFLASMKPEGHIDMKPGLAGQRSGLLATPILASFAWKIFQAKNDRDFLEKVFPPLYDYFKAWLSSDHDRDLDGVPEWDSSLQTGLDDHPIYSNWSDESFGADISKSESQLLCSFLYREANSLLEIAAILQQTEIIDELSAFRSDLAKIIDAFWNPEFLVYQDRDRDSHSFSHIKKFYSTQGPTVIHVDHATDESVRLLIHIHTDSKKTIKPDIYVHGSSISGKNRIEHLTGTDFSWHLGRGTYTGDRVYSKIERIEINDINPDDRVEIYTLGFMSLDISIFMPLWSEHASQSTAAKLINQNLLNPDLYWQPFGISTYNGLKKEELPVADGQVSVLWNSILIEGLLSYGFQDVAAQLMTKIMSAIIQNLKNQNSFRRHYHCRTGKGSGEINILNGLAPTGMFLASLGIRIITQNEFFISGINPYPWPITIKYKGLTIMRQEKSTSIIFPDGQTAELDSSEPHHIINQ